MGLPFIPDIAKSLYIAKTPPDWRDYPVEMWLDTTFKEGDILYNIGIPGIKYCKIISVSLESNKHSFTKHVVKLFK